MKTTNKLTEALKSFEGLRLTAYKCPAGVPTIGYGHTRGVKMGMKITQEQADKYLAEDIERAEADVERLVRVSLTRGQWDALTDFVFNLGAANLRTSTLLQLVNSRASSLSIAKQLRRWVYSGKNVLSGLVKRREWEVQRWNAKE